MKHWMAVRIAKFIVVAAVLLLAVGFVVMGLWNALIPDLFKGPAITYWQAIGLLLLSHFLFHGPGRWRHSGRWNHRYWKHRFDERLASMTPEEREKYREEWRRRCGWYPGEEHEEHKPSHA